MRLTYCYGTGILIIASPATRVTHCQVSQGGYSETTSATGIACVGPGTTVSNCVISTITGTQAYGINAGAGNFIRRNTVSNCAYGIGGGKYQDNLTTNCTHPFSVGTDAGGNN